MASYFDAQSADDLALIPGEYHGLPNLAVMAREAEAEVLRFYTRPTRLGVDYRDHVLVGKDHRVYLLGYAPDPANVVTADYPNFVLDFKRAVAEVLVHKLTQRRREPGALTETDTSGKSRTWRPDASESLPRGWTRWLEPYSTLEPSWGW